MGSFRQLIYPSDLSSLQWLGNSVQMPAVLYVFLPLVVLALVVGFCAEVVVSLAVFVVVAFCPLVVLVAFLVVEEATMHPIATSASYAAAAYPTR